MNSIDYLFIVTAYTIAGIIKGITGIGFSTSCLPIMALRLDLTIAIPLVIIPSIVSNIVLMIQAGHFTKVFRRFWPIYIASIPGLLLGLSLLLSIDINLAKTVLGAVLILYSLMALSKKTVTISSRWEYYLKVPVGFLTGFINGLTGSQVMPVLPYLLSINLKKDAFIQAINISFTLSSLIMLFGIHKFGHLSAQTIYTAVSGIIPVIAVVFFCSKTRSLIPEAAYRNLVLLFLLSLGVILVVKSIL